MQPFRVGQECTDIARAYDEYAVSRNHLHDLETAGAPAHVCMGELERVMGAKEVVASIASKLHGQIEGSDNFYREISNRLGASRYIAEDGRRMAANDYMAGAFLMPLSLQREEIPSAVESIEATVDNLAIAEVFKQAVQNTGVSMLMSGTNAWGGFYAVRGGVPRAFRQAGVPQLECSKFSDIDLLVAGNAVDDLREALEVCVEQELVDSNERHRFDMFTQLRNSGQADLFSVRTHYGDVEESIHFVPFEFIHKITANEELRRSRSAQGIELSVARDFRPNIPGNVRRLGNYPVFDLRRLRDDAYSPQIDEILTEDNTRLGYLCENTIDSRADVAGEHTYYMGVLSFFLSVEPVMLLDPGNELTDASKTLQRSIADTLDGNTVTYVPRQERMPSYTIRKVYGSLGQP